MNIASEGLFIGWDVGGWNCDRNGLSRDALVILNGSNSLLGKPWRGNLREALNRPSSTREWISTLFHLCGASEPQDGVPVTLAIATPLGFSEPFLRLANGLQGEGPIGASNTNPYLFRQTELHLFRQGLNPLSAIKDMIGSQATKGMHALAKFAPHRVGTGVWTDGACLTAIEAYPSACKASPTIQALRQSLPAFDHEDKNDALTCALVAYLFATQITALEAPGPDVPEREGWIWVPRVAFETDETKSPMDVRLP